MYAASLKNVEIESFGLILTEINVFVNYTESKVPDLRYRYQYCTG